MISQHEIQAMSENIIQLYTQLEDDLVSSISKRFDADDEVESIENWRTDKLIQLGGLRRDTVAAVAHITGKTQTEIQRVLTEAGYKSLNFDEQIYQKAYSAGLLVKMPVPARASDGLKHVLTGMIDNTRKYFNLINTTALESADQSFLRVINQTYLETSTGVSDYNTSIRKAVRQLADQGITGAHYVSAKGTPTNTHIDVAVRRCIVTSTSQTAGVMQEQRAKEWGSNLVEVTSYMGARPTHAEWQGRIFSLDGGTTQYPNLRAVTGYGTVTGLKGVNCGHDFYPYFPGISEQTYKPYNKKANMKVYEESQQQRSLERDIRQQKRRVLAADNANDKEGKVAAQLALKGKESQLRAFTKQTGRTQRDNRQQVLDFGHRQATQAVWAKRKSDL